MALVDLTCDNCGLKVTDYFIGTGLIPDGWTPPTCDKCGGPNRREYLGINFNLRTADLPGAGFEGYQPAFNCHTRSKSDVFSKLKEMNQNMKDKAIDAKVPFNEYHWVPEDRHMDEMDSLRKEYGADVVNAQYNNQREVVASKTFEEKMDKVFTEAPLNI